MVALFVVAFFVYMVVTYSQPSGQTEVSAIKYLSVIYQIRSPVYSGLQCGQAW